MTTIRFTPFGTGTTNTAGEHIGSIDPMLSRTNYFDGQLLKAADLYRDQIYLDQRLIELGQAFGAGIVQGLELTLKSGHLLELKPGIAIAPSGRVLQLSAQPLTIDLLDSGLIAAINNGRFSGYATGLYALALTHTEMVDGLAEAYPKDLAAPRTPQISSWVEGVELRLIPLPLPLPHRDEITVRAALVRELLGGGERLALPSDDAVALGLIAVERGRILWLDRGLLRRPRRALHSRNALQQDLAAHYEELLQTVLAARRSSGLLGAFAASQYFQLLPPCGSLPRESIDPVNGRQQFFPKDFEVSIAPLRRSEVDSVLADSMQLAPIDLERDADCDVMVLVPMSDAAFALRARQLEAPPLVTPRALGRLPRLDRLTLRVLPQPPIHRIDTDEDVWRAIWADADPAELFYVRRPPRTAETGVSAVVLALGSSLPLPAAPLPSDAARLEAELDAALEAADAAEEARGALETESTRLKIRIGELEKAVALGGDQRLADALSEIEKRSLALEAAEKEIASLKSDQRNAAVLANAIEAMSAKIDRLKTELQSARDEAERLKKATAPGDEALKRQVTELARTLDDERAKTIELEKANSSLSTGLNAERLRADTLDAGLEEAKIKLKAAADTDSSLKSAREEIDKLKTEIEEKRKVQERTAAELADASKQLDASREREASSSERIERVQIELSNANQNNSVLHKERTALEERAKKAEAEIEKFKDERGRSPVLQGMLTLESLARMRGADAAGVKAAAAADKLIGGDDSARLAAVQIVAQTDRRADKALWPSVQAMAKADASDFEKLRDHTAKSRDGNALPKWFAAEGPKYKLSTDQIELWKSLGG